MRKLALMLAQCLLLAGCTGLPQPREMGDMALLRTVGVDAAEQGISLIGSTGLRASGMEGEKQEPLILKGTGASLSAAAMKLREDGGSYVFFGYVDQLLLGADYGSMSDVLGWFSQDGELGLGARVWLLRDSSAAQAVEAENENGVEERLSALELDAKLGVAPMTRTAGEVYSALLDRGCAFLPTLNGADGLTAAGYAVVRGDEVVGFLEEESARGLELLAERPMAEILEAELPENRVSLRLTGAQLDCKPRFSGENMVRLELTGRVQVKVRQWERDLTTEEREQVCAAVEVQLARRMNGALEKLRDWRAECVGIGSRVAIAAPRRWQSMEANWQEIFSSVPCEIRIRVSLE